MLRLTKLWIAGLAMLGLLAFTGQASADVLYDQTEPEAFIESTVSQDFEAAFDSRDTMGADDFTVPKGEEWLVESVLAHGKHLGAENTPTAFRVTIFEDDGGMPGSVLIQQENTDFSPYPGRTVINFAPAEFIQPGKYWLSIQAIMTSNIDAPGDASRWFWGFNDNGPFGSPAVFKNPGGGWPEFDCAEFATFAGCDMPEGVHNQDYSFLINGISSVTAECAATFEAVAAANAAIGSAKGSLSRANKALAKGKKAVKKAKAKLRKAKKKARKKASKALKKAKARSKRAQKPALKARQALAAAQSKLNEAKAAQSAACG